MHQFPRHSAEMNVYWPVSGIIALLTVSVEVFTLQAEMGEKWRDGDKDQPLSGPFTSQFCQHVAGQFPAYCHIVSKVRSLSCSLSETFGSQFKELKIWKFTNAAVEIRQRKLRKNCRSLEDQGVEGKAFIAEIISKQEDLKNSLCSWGDADTVLGSHRNSSQINCSKPHCFTALFQLFLPGLIYLWYYMNNKTK